MSTETLPDTTALDKTLAEIATIDEAAVKAYREKVISIATTGDTGDAIELRTILLNVGQTPEGLKADVKIVVDRYAAAQGFERADVLDQEVAELLPKIEAGHQQVREVKERAQKMIWEVLGPVREMEDRRDKLQRDIHGLRRGGEATLHRTANPAIGEAIAEERRSGISSVDPSPKYKSEILDWRNF